MRNIAILTLELCFVASIASAETYKWRDKNGTIHFSDNPMTSQKFEVYDPDDINTSDSQTQSYSSPQIESQVKQPNQEQHSEVKVPSRTQTEAAGPKPFRERIKNIIRRQAEREEMDRRAGIIR